MALFVLVKVGKAGFGVRLKIFEKKKGSSFYYDYYYYRRQIDSILPCFCSVIDHRGRQNVVRTSVALSTISGVPFFVLTTF